jgi:hypothetical protein
MRLINGGKTQGIKKIMLIKKLKKMNLLQKGFYILLLLLTVTVSCNDDDELTQIAGLDFVIANLNDAGNKVGIVPTTVAGVNVLYTIDFDATSDDDSDVFQTSGPMVTYTYPNQTVTYRITITASSDGAPDVSITKEYTVIKAAVAPTNTAIVGTWKLAPEAGAIGVGPEKDDVSWWSNGTADVATRACLFDDEYVFNADGTFKNVIGSDTWVEAWQGAAAEGCAAPVFPHDGTASALYTFNSSTGTITIEGAGAFLGLSKAYNGGELTTPSEAAETITYIATISADGNTLELDIEIAGGGFWSFKLVKEGGTTPPPVAASGIAGTWKLAPEAGAIGVGPGKDDVSWWSNGTADVATRACLFDDKYVFNADGTFKNVLGSDTWVEGWQGAAAEGCAAPVFPHNGTASATYTYNATTGTIKIDGAGAYLGLAKAYNGGELTTPSEAPEAITYLANLSTDGNTLELDIEIAGGGFWSFKLVRDVPPAGIEGVWKLAPEAGAIGVGPGKDDVSWWSNSTADVATRGCLFDDQYVFNADGTFQNVLGSDTWVESWQGAAAEGCAAPVFPHNGTASATYTYNATAGTIKIDGAGAFLGLAKAYNGGELTTPSEAPDSITYIAVQNGNTLELDIEIAGGGFWSFKLVR